MAPLILHHNNLLLRLWEHLSSSDSYDHKTTPWIANLSNRLSSSQIALSVANACCCTGSVSNTNRDILVTKSGFFNALSTQESIVAKNLELCQQLLEVIREVIVERKKYLDGLRAGKKPITKVEKQIDPGMRALDKFLSELARKKKLLGSSVNDTMEFIESNMEAVYKLSDSRKYNLMQILYAECGKLSSGPYIEQEMAIYEATHGRKFPGTKDDFADISYAVLFPEQ